MLEDAYTNLATVLGYRKTGGKLVGQREMKCDDKATWNEFCCDKPRRKETGSDE